MIHKMVLMVDKKTCFIISTIGEEGTPERKLADDKYDLGFKPILDELNYDITKADKIGTPGSISYDIVHRIMTSTLVIADVSDLNPNVFYELAIRNAIKKPVIVIKGVSQKMPFDIYDKRAISVDMKEARVWTNAKNQLKNQVEESEKDIELASKSILSEFSFPIDAEKELSPNTELTLQIRDLKNEVRRLRNDVSDSRHQSSLDYYDPYNDEPVDLSILQGTPRSEFSKMQLFMDIMRSLEGDKKKPVELKLFINELVRSKKFTEQSGKTYLRRMLREASVYESKPGHYNRV